MTSKKWVPYLLLAPGALWLALFFLTPMFNLGATSLYDPSGSLETGYVMNGHVGNYVDALSEYWPQFLRSFTFAAIATVLALIIAYPLAYAIWPVEEHSLDLGDCSVFHIILATHSCMDRDSG